VRLAWSLLASFTILLAGCSVASIANQEPEPGPVAAVNTPLTGRVHGGPPQAPISGAEVYLFAVHTGTGAYNHNSDSLMNATTNTHAGSYGNYVSTGSDGTFQIHAADYTCTAGQEVYLYSVGGNPGLANGTNNSAATLMSVVGTCGSGNSFTGLPASVQMNEVTTVAAAYALGGYATTPTKIGGNQSGTQMAITGLDNAIKMAGVLASITTGKALAPGIYGTYVQEKINSLANSLAACVNQTGPSASGCTNLFPYAGNTTDTASAALYIAHTGAGATTGQATGIYNASTAFPQFSPVLGGAPNDWTLAITYDGNLNGAQDLAIDSTGAVYVTETDANDVVKYTAFGARVGSPFSNNGLNEPYGIAVDPSGSDNIWVANWNDDDISGFTSSGSALAHSPIVNTALNNSFNVAIDGSGNIWSTNFSNSNLTEFNTSGTLLFNSSTKGSHYGALNGPDGISIEPGTAGDIWVTNPDGVSGTTLSRFNNAGASTAYYVSGGYTTSGMVGPISSAIDSSGRIWTSNYGGSFSGVSGSTISVFDSNGGSPSSFNGGGVSGSYGGAYWVAIDGAGHVWIANLGVDQAPNGVQNWQYLGGSISEFDSTGTAISGSNGFLPGLNNGQNFPESDKPDSIAVDGSGNVWVVNNGDGSLTELVGAATPVVTPLSVGVKNSKLGTAP
jgi:hypothetical protein